MPGSVDSASRVYSVKCVTLWQVDFSVPFLFLLESENVELEGPFGVTDEIMRSTGVRVDGRGDWEKLETRG